MHSTDVELHTTQVTQPNVQRPHRCFPSICQLRDGGLLASWREGTSKDSEDGTVCFARSTDGGRTWGDPIRPFDGRSESGRGTYDLEGVPGSLHLATLTALPDGRVLASMMWLDRSVPGRPMFNDATDGLVRVETLLTWSEDGGLTWNEPRMLDASPYDGLCGVCAPALLLPDGRLAAQLETNKAWDDPEPWKHRAILKFSDDGGRTWPGLSVVAHDPSARLRYWDQRHAIAPDGAMLAGLWLFDAEQREEQNFHLTESLDGGQTWSQPWDSGLDYQLPYPVFLPDGRLIVFVIDRYRSRAIRALLSNDSGRTFSDQEFIVYQHVGTNQGQHDHQMSDQQAWSFGRVEAITTGEDTIHGVYYAGSEQSTAIYGFVLRLPSKETDRC